jgi:hypothetical protein
MEFVGLKTITWGFFVFYSFIYLQYLLYSDVWQLSMSSKYVLSLNLKGEIMFLVSWFDKGLRENFLELNCFIFYPEFNIF